MAFGDFMIQVGVDGGDERLFCHECGWESYLDDHDYRLDILNEAAEAHFRAKHQDATPMAVYESSGGYRANCECGFFISYYDKNRVQHVADIHFHKCSAAGERYKSEMVDDGSIRRNEHKQRDSGGRPDIPHYTSGDVEPIDYIFAHGWGDGFCRGNVIKYVTRAGQKTGQDKVGDLEKAETYLQFLIDKHDRSMGGNKFPVCVVCNRAILSGEEKSNFGSAHFGCH